MEVVEHYYLDGRFDVPLDLIYLTLDASMSDVLGDGRPHSLAAEGMLCGPDVALLMLGIEEMTSEGGRDYGSEYPKETPSSETRIQIFFSWSEVLPLIRAATTVSYCCSLLMRRLSTGPSEMSTPVVTILDSVSSMIVGTRDVFNVRCELKALGKERKWLPLLLTADGVEGILRYADRRSKSKVVEEGSGGQGYLTGHEDCYQTASKRLAWSFRIVRK